jgi:hypothetical protein
MSYCRFSEADAYIFLGTDGLNCCACSLAERTQLKEPYVDIFGIAHEYTYDQVVFSTAQEMLDHIKIHREAGDYISERVDERLREEFPDPTVSTVETEEERLARQARDYPATERLRAKLKSKYEEGK